MAQLRDARTSALIAEGTPLEMVTLADKLEKGTYTYDDVGGAFDPSRLRADRAEELRSLAAAVERADDPETKKALEGTLAERHERIAVGNSLVQSAKKLQNEAVAASMLAEAEEKRKA